MMHSENTNSIGTQNAQNEQRWNKLERTEKVRVTQERDMAFILGYHTLYPFAQEDNAENA